jgi:5-methylcytosine-specific restriction enzyme subunit McrC
MTVVTLDEGGGWVMAKVSPATADALEKESIATVGRKPDGTPYRLKAKLRVGAVRFPDLELCIRPKLSISRLWFLLGFAYDKVERGWQEQEVTAWDQLDLLPAMAYAFLHATGKALAYGLPHGYRRESRALPVVRGRIREADQLRRHHGQMLPIEVEYSSLTFDVPETRVLRAATERLLALPGVASAAEVRLHDLLRLLDHASPPRPRAIPSWTPTPSNARYQTALGLADLVLRGGSLEFQGNSDKLTVNGLLFYMDKVFEDFLEHALGGLLTPHGGVCNAQGVVYLDTANKLKMETDVRWWEGDRTHAIIDAKYSAKPMKAEYRYQILAYCARFGSPQGHIVYAGGNREPTRRHQIINPRIELFEHTLDLSAPIDEIRAQVQAIADQILALARPAAST